MRSALLVVAVLVVACGDDGTPALAATTGGAASTSSSSTTESTTATTADPSGATTSGATTSGATTSGATTDDSPPFVTDGVDGTWGASTGCGFTCPNTPPPNTPCSISAQDCPADQDDRDDQKCAGVANDGSQLWTASRCTSLDDNPVGLGETCTHEGLVGWLDNCDRGLWCRPTNEGEGVCVALCGALPEGCPDDQVCVQPGLANVGTCAEVCDPLDPISCPEGTGCMPAGFGFGCAFANFVDRDNCQTDSQCGGDAACLSPEEDPTCKSEGCCAQFCDLQDPQCSDPTATCTDYGSPLAAYDDVGLCLPSP